MAARAVAPTAATLGALIGLAAEARAWGRVVEAWGWLQAAGLPAHVGFANAYLTALLKLVIIRRQHGGSFVVVVVVVVGGGGGGNVSLTACPLARDSSA